jgi:hypothetical protein
MTKRITNRPLRSAFKSKPPPKQPFSTITPLYRAGTNKHQRPIWHCRCVCGKEFDLNQGVLRYRKSCGCQNRQDAVRNRNVTHLPEYKIYRSMLARCESPTDSCWEDYGGRGIKVCKEWTDSFAVFLSDMGARPSRHHSIDRINNDGNYEPSNCRWATRAEQIMNRRVTIFHTVDGVKKTLKEWCLEKNVDYLNALWRFHNGYDPLCPLRNTRHQTVPI